MRRAVRTDYLTSPRLRTPLGEKGGLSLDRGYFLAEQAGNLVGCIGWRVENLVARLDDLRLAPLGVEEQGYILERLLRAVHRAAEELQCEVVLLALDAEVADRAEPALSSLGYWPSTPDALSRHHREAGVEMLRPGQVLWVFPLRPAPAARPLG